MARTCCQRRRHIKLPWVPDHAYLVNSLNIFPPFFHHFSTTSLALPLVCRSSGSLAGPYSIPDHALQRATITSWEFIGWLVMKAGQFLFRMKPKYIAGQSQAESLWWWNAMKWLGNLFVSQIDPLSSRWGNPCLQLQTYQVIYHKAQHKN
jgi:hypothetical protein